jgi:uncharacterized protein YraI
MIPTRFALAAAIALGALAAAPAHASQARASGDTPVRIGPGGGYGIIDYLEDGEYYDVEDCTRQTRWCLVSDDGDVLGWVRGSYLIGSGAKVEATPFEPLVKAPFPFTVFP